MIDPYDPHHPDGPDDDDELPGAPAGISWLDDDDPAEEEWSSPFATFPTEPAEAAVD